MFQLQFFLGIVLLIASRIIYRSFRVKEVTGREGLVGQTGRALENIAKRGRIYVAGEYWEAVPAESGQGIIDKDCEVEVVGMGDGMVFRNY